MKVMYYLLPLLYLIGISEAEVLLSLQDKSEAPGQEVTFSINISNSAGQDIIGIDLEISFNPLILSFKDVETSDLTRRWSVEYNLIDNKLKIGLASSRPLAGEGELLKLIFSVSETAKPGEVTSLSFDKALLNEGQIPASSEDGTFTVKAPDFQPIPATLIVGRILDFIKDAGLKFHFLQGQPRAKLVFWKYHRRPPGAGPRTLPYYWVIHHFSKQPFKVKIYFHYEDADVEAAGLNEQTMILAYRDEDGFWHPVPTQRDTQNNLLWTETTHLSEWAIGDESSLPVGLSHFSAEVKHRSVILKWEGQDETETVYWEIYRRAKDQKFRRIARIEAKTGEPSAAYIYSDKVTESGVYYYYLLRTKLDGTTERFPTIEVKVPDLRDLLITTLGRVKHKP